MTLGTKIFSSFAIMLLFLAVIAYVGYTGLSGVVNRIDKADDVNRLVKMILETRQQEKNYIIRDEDSYAAKVKEDVARLIRQANETTGKFNQQLNKDKMAQVIEKVNDYARAFKEYVALDQEKDATMTAMEERARVALAQAGAIRSDQNKQLLIGKNKEAAKVADKLAKADDANRLIKWFIDVRKNEKETIIYNGADKYKQRMEEAFKKIETLSADLKSRFKLRKNIAQIETVMDGMDQYQQAYQTLNNNARTGADLQAPLAEIRRIAYAVLPALEAIRADQKAQLATIQKDADAFLEDKLAKSGDANRLIKWFLDARKNEKEFIISNGDPQWMAEVEAEISKILTLARDLKSRFKQANNIEQINAVIAAIRDYDRDFKRFAGLMEKQTLADNAMVAAARGANGVCAEARADQKAKMDSQISTAETIMLLGSLIAIILGALMAIFITRGITKPLNRVIEGMGEGASQVAAASSQVSSASQSLAEGSSQQAASIEETSSSLEEMSSMTKQNAENAGQADKLMTEANQVVKRANSSMEHLTLSMEEISKASNETSKIIKTIDEIAFQTNLLALNAAVEAARAGEAGAGFAVVAEEVRNLAMRSAEAAKDTAELIESTVKKVQDGSDLVNQTNTAFTEVAESSSKVGELIGEISEASREQSTGIEQVNTAVSEMDRVTQQNAANAEESASASEEMNAQAESMREFVIELATLVGGTGTGSPRQAPMTKPVPKTIPRVSAAPKVKIKAKSLGAPRQGEVRPDQVIPFDEDEFTDF
ncbi:MAG: chemotaxis protein [Desulfobacteraceae bacterium]|nr:chemotaxis protein [Desulfobacteraceae bacterium]